MKSAFSEIQSHPFFKSPILVIDRFGLIGEQLSLKLSRKFSIVFVSGRNLSPDREKKNIIKVPFSGKFPVIPDAKYSHIVFVDEEGADLDLLPKIIDKAKKVNANFIFAQGISIKGEYAVSKILRSYPSAKVALLGDVFDKELILGRESFKSAINRFIYQAQRFGKMQVLGEGLKEAYPVFLSDAVDGLIALVFGVGQSRSLFYLFPKHPTTELSLAHMIQKGNPEVTIDFAKHDPRLGKITYPPNGEYLLEGKYPLAKKVREIGIRKKTTIKSGDLSGSGKKTKSFSFFIVWTLIFLLFLPLIFTSIFSFLGLKTLYYAKGELDGGNFTHAKSSLHLSQFFFYVAKKTSDALFFQARIIGREGALKVFLRDLDAGNKMSGALSQAFNSGNYFSKILNGKSENPVGDFAKGTNYLKSSMLALNNIRAEGKISASVLQNLEIINPLIRLLFATSDIMPNIFGMETPRTYLILFQNNMKLRPGGGLIDSYGILSFDMGKITHFSIHDTRGADENLRGHVEPPFAIRRYAPSQHWYMKDSSFDINFAKIASSSSNFLFAETGQKVSGVISVDIAFAKKILHAIGPVHMEDYKETVDENNIYTLVQSHREENFLKSLYETIVPKIAGGKMSYLLIAQAISDSLEQKHLMFAFDEWQNIFTVNGWSSSLWDERKDSKESINDFVGINEANLGANKINNFIYSDIFQEAIIGDDGSVFSETTIKYKNAGTALSGGAYRNYLRLVLPFNTAISEISVNDISQSIINAVTDPLIYEAKNFKPPVGLEVEKTSEENKTIYGFMVNIPAGQIVKVKVKYNLVRKAPLDGNIFSYNLKLFKQPGIDSMPYSFSLSYPNSLNVVNVSEGIRKENGKLFYSKKITGDENILIDFAKK